MASVRPRSLTATRARPARPWPVDDDGVDGVPAPVEVDGERAVARRRGSGGPPRSRADTSVGRCRTRCAAPLDGGTRRLTCSAGMPFSVVARPRAASPTSRERRPSAPGPRAGLVERLPVRPVSMITTVTVARTRAPGRRRGRTTRTATPRSRSAYCPLTLVSVGSAVRTVTVAPRAAGCRPAGPSPHQPVGSQNRGLLELDVVALLLEQQLACAPVSANSDGTGSGGGRWPPSPRSRPRRPPGRARQGPVRKRCGGAPVRAGRVPRGPAGRGPRRVGSACAARAVRGRPALGLGVGAAELRRLLDEPAVARRDVLVELHVRPPWCTVRPRSRVSVRGRRASPTR